MASHWGVNTAHMLLTTQSRQVTFHGGLYQKRHNEKATYTLYTSSLLSRPAHIPWRTAAAGQDHSPPLWRGCRCCAASSPTDLRTSAETTETQMIPTSGARQVVSSSLPVLDRSQTQIIRSNQLSAVRPQLCKTTTKATALPHR